jgi:hypothetical protein
VYFKTEKEWINMARGSGGVFGKLVLLGVGAVIGAAMTQKKVESDGTSTSQAGNLKENVKKGLERFNEQSGGMVDKVKPGVNKAVETVKSAIESQQKMMDKEKDALDKANETLQKETGSSSSGSSSGSSSAGSPSKNPNAGLSSSDLAGSGTSGTAGGSAGSVGSTSSSSASGTGSTGASSGSDAIDSTPTGGIYGGSTEYTESLKKDIAEKDSSDSKSSNNSTFGK